MEDSYFRLLSVELKNIRNVSSGKLEFSELKETLKGNFSQSSDIIGLYGPNGSGKTAAIDTFDLLKKIVAGKEILDKANIKIINDNYEILLYCEDNFFGNQNENDFIWIDQPFDKWKFSLEELIINE